jgi:hypothetical protein
MAARRGRGRSVPGLVARLRLPRLAAPGPAGDPARDAGLAARANLRRNAQGPPGRPVAWRPARDALWAVLDPLVAPGDAVALVGAGNADDVPLARLAARAARVDLIDLDGSALRGAVRRAPAALRHVLRPLPQDVTDGAADAIIAAAVAGRRPPPVEIAPRAPLGTGGYDLVIGDLLYSQLLFPALLDLGVAPGDRQAILEDAGARLTQALVARMHASAPGSRVLHLHDTAGWWEGHRQPHAIEDVLALDPAAALALDLHRPVGCDPRDALARLGIPVQATTMWRWPFTRGTDYLVVATLAG